MLNADYKEQAIKDLQNIDKNYTSVFQKTISDTERLQNTRTISVRTIQSVEKYIVGIVHRPKDYDTKIEQIRTRYVKFNQDTQKTLEKKQEDNIQIKKNGMAGALGGVGVAALTPTAAMSVAMTFGTASTGTAIASLSGAAATNAALAWLGGGTLAAGGAGMAGGQVLISLAGPIGWAISGLSLSASLLKLNMSNREIAKKAEESTAKIKKEMERIKELDCQVLALNAETIELSNLISKNTCKLKMNRKKDFNQFSEDEQAELMSLMNSTEVLSKLLSKKLNAEAGE